MSKRLLLLACAGALLAASCSEPPTGASVDFGSGQAFVPYVVDFLDDVGAGNGVAVDADGVPYVSYWGFTGVVKPGAIPTSRAIGMPYLPAVLLASELDGIFTRGAVAQVRDTPSGITIPYAPATVASLMSAEPRNVNGTDVAVDAGGARHVAWAANTGIWYATGTDSSQAEQVTKQTPQLNRAGPLGWPSIAVDADGTPWIAYTVNTGAGMAVTVATPNDDGWEEQVVDTTVPCAGCARAPRTQVVVTDAGPEVVYVDGGSGAVKAAINDGENGWVSFTVESGVSGAGLSAAAAPGGGIAAAYYTGDGEVHVATSSDGTTWDVAAAGTVSDDADLAGEPQATTGVAVTEDGALYVTWSDPATEDVRLVSSTDGAAFEPVDAGTSTADGAYPSVAATADGSRVFLTWYDTATQDLMLGIWGDVEGLAVAAPSPTPEVKPPPPPSDCGDDGEIALTIVAQGTAFDTDCLVAPAGEAFTITFDNEDAGIPHNVAGYTAQGGDSLFTDAPFPGVATHEVQVDALDEGTYFFQCDVHPTSMYGTLAVVSGGGGGGGGGSGNAGGGAATGATGASGATGATGSSGGN